ncbi:MAG: DUF6178 family protein [Desulfobacterales bacterium]|nr:DUF6178 family protein [Desulfobacterales bacterium]
MPNANADHKMLALRRELAAQRRQCLALPPEQALTHILEHSQPAALVHSFPEEDFYFLLQEIGPDDALPLVTLGSYRQLEFVLDQQVWDRDRIDFKSLFVWFERLIAADPTRMVRWLAAEKSNLVEYYLFNSIAIRMREHDQDPADFGPSFFSFDNFFYVRILDIPATEPLGEALQKQHRRLVRRILERLAEDDHVHYQRLLLAAMNVVPAEAEEEAYRLRNVRLAEKGFLPFEEAVGLYQPLRFDHFHQTAARFQSLVADENTRLPMAPLDLIASDQLFHQALRAIPPGEALDQIQSEFASLSNRITVADRLKPESRAALSVAVHKACGYLSIGLERLEPTPPLAASAARNLQAFTLEGLFRLGYSQAVVLKQEAENWVTASWFARAGLPLTFWGETGLGVLGGLLLKRPLFFDRDRQGHRYREFHCLDDIQATGAQLAQLRAIDRLLDQMPIEKLPRRYGHLTYQNVLLTLWARSALGLADDLQPIAREAFGVFWESLFLPPPQGTTPAGRVIGDDRRQAFLQWLARQTGSDADELADAVGAALTSLFDELQTEYGRVSRASIDPRYIHHFLVAPDKSAAD